MNVTAENLLSAVVQMPESDFERFLKKANALRKKQVIRKISSKESDLILKINTVFPTDKREAYNLLYEKSHQETLTESEHRELLKLNDEFEILNAERIKYIGELAKIRRQTLEEVINDLQIKTSRV
jgi:hypothetical protein